VDRVEAYRADITNGTNSEFVLIICADNMAMRLDARVQRGHYYAIVDEVDNVLIDEARTPLIISGPSSGDLEYYTIMANIVKQLRPKIMKWMKRNRGVSLTEVGISHVEALLGTPLLDPDRPEDLTPSRRVSQASSTVLARAVSLCPHKEYLVQAARSFIVDEFTGGRCLGADGAMVCISVEAKEGVKVEPENVTYATITCKIISHV